MGAELDDVAGVHHRDPVSVVGGVEAVGDGDGDGDDGASFDGGSQRAFGLPCRAGVQEGGRFVEDEGVGAGQEYPGEGDVLGLGTGELVAGEIGVESVREFVDPVGSDDQQRRP